jgi:hypothetical protein
MSLMIVLLMILLIEQEHLPALHIPTCLQAVDVHAAW